MVMGPSFTVWYIRMSFSAAPYTSQCVSDTRDSITYISVRTMYVTYMYVCAYVYVLVAWRYMCVRAVHMEVYMWLCYC